MNNILSTASVAASTLAVLLGGHVVTAQSDGPTPNIQVTGRSVLSVQPERVQVDVGVVTEAPDADAAARQNADKLDAVLRSLRSTLGAEAKIETVSYSLNPKYERPDPRSQAVVSGYTATNVVRLRNLELDAVGKAIDLATAAGANSVRNIAFSLRDESPVKQEALKLAALDARAKANTLASALGVGIERILSVSEGAPDIIRPSPMFRAELAQAAAAPTPVEPGTIEVNASVTLIVEISQ